MNIDVRIRKHYYIRQTLAPQVELSLAGAESRLLFRPDAITSEVSDLLQIYTPPQCPACARRTHQLSLIDLNISNVQLWMAELCVGLGTNLHLNVRRNMPGIVTVARDPASRPRHTAVIWTVCSGEQSYNWGPHGGAFQHTLINTEDTGFHW